MDNFLLDLNSSSAQIDRYWVSLRRRAITGGVAEDYPLRSSLYAPHFYANSTLADSDANRQIEAERSGISDIRELKDPTGLLVNSKPFANFIQHPLIDSNSLEGKFSETLKESLELINEIWPEAYREFLSLCASVAWFSGDIHRSYSSPKLFGTIFVNPGVVDFGVVELANSIVHEMGHQALFVETARDRLIPDEFTKPVFSPFKNESRPAIAALHALVAMARMIKFSELLRSKQRFPEYASRTLSKLIPMFSAGLELERQVRLSPAGVDLFRVSKNLMSKFR